MNVTGNKTLTKDKRYDVLDTFGEGDELYVKVVCDNDMYDWFNYDFYFREEQ